MKLGCCVIVDDGGNYVTFHELNVRIKIKKTIAPHNESLNRLWEKQFRFCNQVWFILQILLPAIFVCLAMIVSQIRPFSEMPALELNTNMFLEVDPHEHYVAFAEDGDRRTFMTKDMTDNLVRYPGVGKQIIFLLGVRIAFLLTRESVSKLRVVVGDGVIVYEYRICSI